MKGHDTVTAGGRVIVMGGGAAGVWAALSARRAGAQVTLVRQAPGATAVSSGCLDLACARDLDGGSAPPERAAGALAKSHSDHPYAALGAELPSAIARARGAVIEWHAGLGVTGAEGRNLLLATPLGTVKETWLAQGTIARGDLLSWPRDARLGVVAPPNRTAFDAAAVSAGLTAIGRATLPVDVELKVHPFASTVELARLLDDPAIATPFAARVAAKARAAGATHVLLPTAGTRNPGALLDAIVSAGVAGAAEMMGVPPSVPGLRFERDLCDIAASAGINWIAGHVRDAAISSGRVRALHLEDGREIVGDAFVLATGRFLGGGIRHEGVFRESVFGLPVFVNRQDVADRWLGDLLDRNAAAEQAALKAGVAVDGAMRPVDDRGRPVLENLFAAGSVIGGYDPAKDGTGLGVAAVTALVAGGGAAQAAHEHDGEPTERPWKSSAQTAAEDPRA
jgi:glycerol-3-phosphate dehydrogenase subunit B